MKRSNVKVGTIVSAKSDEEIAKPFIGKVEKVYENSALLEITHYDPIDEIAVSDLNNKIVVNFKNLKASTGHTAKNVKAANPNEVKVEKLKPKKENNDEQEDK